MPSSPTINPNCSIGPAIGRGANLTKICLMVCFGLSSSAICVATHFRFFPLSLQVSLRVRFCCTVNSSFVVSTISGRVIPSVIWSSPINHTILAAGRASFTVHIALIVVSSAYARSLGSGSGVTTSMGSYPGALATVTLVTPSDSVCSSAKPSEHLNWPFCLSSIRAIVIPHWPALMPSPSYQ